MPRLTVGRFLEKAAAPMESGRIYGRQFLVNVISHSRLFTLGEADSWKNLTKPGTVLVGSDLAFPGGVWGRGGNADISAFTRPPPAFLALSQPDANHGDASRLASFFSCPVVTSCLNIHLLTSRLRGSLQEQLDGERQICGCLMTVAGVGVLVTGESGVGKTTACLALAGRGHDWVSDDVVAARRTPDGALVGSSPGAVNRLLSLRGRGVIPADDLIPTDQIRKNSPINLVVELLRNKEAETKDKADSIQPMEKTHILGVSLPFYQISIEGIKDAADRIESIAKRSAVACR